MKYSILSLFSMLLGLTVILFSSCKDDEGTCSEVTWYQDADDDGLGNPDVTFVACEAPTGYVSNSDDPDDTDSTNAVTLDVISAHFTDANSETTVTMIPCTLSDGTETECYQVVTNTTPGSDHEMGPWCPRNISDDDSAGGIWLEGGEVYDVDGAFVENMATFYNDDNWLMYDANGDIYISDSEEDCTNAANPNVGAAYRNFCVECLPSYITGLSQTYLIPITPVKLSTPVQFATMGPPGMGGNTGPAVRGVALNGVEFSAAAPVNNILGAYTLAPFDDAGGHINVNQGYHYHAATGMSHSVSQSDGHAPLIGYALDGHGIYGLSDVDGTEPSDLDECRGHTDDIRGYHYHVDAAGNNNFFNCIHGAYVN